MGTEGGEEYDAAFYDRIDEGSVRSAQVAYPVIAPLIGPVGSMVDVGCGSGAWGSVFQREGWTVLGVDGEYARERAAPRVPFVAHDLTQRLVPDARAFPGAFDLAVSLEVAEHLPPERAGSFVDDLCHLAPTILFSAAIPGQGGTNHVNEQWPDYWAEKFRARGRRVSGALRWLLWDLDGIENWYRMNMLFVTDDPRRCEVLDQMAMRVIHRPISVVHPVLYEHIHPRL